MALQTCACHFFLIQLLSLGRLYQISFPKCSAPGATKWQSTCGLLLNGLGRLCRSTGSYVSGVDVEPETQIIYALFTIQGLRSHAEYRLCNCTVMGREIARLGLSKPKPEPQKLT